MAATARLEAFDPASQGSTTGFASTPTELQLTAVLS